ncbi:ARM repeat-containing protein [Wolfiporia cocos MD-104 SS10]|uniref:ARM repeat-containing protein n=1 Tax=Wolfiporia cocos (strain MD-104) TaxID=742152 RepID=A0A2H3J6L1_WOLCO|nr:ARM repeat-containing protein [Wolfiporia cocos MD-104 SS10]
MTIRSVNLLTLRKAKNSIIGNPTAKQALASDDAFIETLVVCINDPPPTAEVSASQEDTRIEAAHIIASLSYGSSDALRSLLRCNAQEELLDALSRFPSSEPSKVKAALARALRALGTAIADEVGPSQWGLKSGSSDVRSDAKDALEYLFQPEIMDMYLPLLVDPSTQTSATIAQLIAAVVRTKGHAETMSGWLPPSERMMEVKGKRGWEKPDVARSPSRQGSWVVRHLIALLHKKDVKVQEAALSALAALAKENEPVALSIAKAPPDREATLPMIMALCKSRTAEVALSACLCAVHVIREAFRETALAADISPALSVMYVVNRFISSDSDSAQTRMKACFILTYLVSDKRELCEAANKRGSLARLATLIKSITPIEKGTEWEEDEPHSISCLREAALTAVAYISLFADDIRVEVADTHKLIPAIQASLSHPHVGVRFAACHCARALSRAVAVLRTNIVDSGLGMAVYRLFRKADEDRHVAFAASAVVCNLVNDCSPLRPTLLEQGLMPRLVQLLHAGDLELRLNALWAVKNLLYHSTSEIKRRAMDAIGWDELGALLREANPDIQEQAFHIVRHLADGTEDVDMVFDKLGVNMLLDLVACAMYSDHYLVVHQAVCALANLANSIAHQDSILTHPRILSSLKDCLVDARADVRRPAVSCVYELVRVNPGSHKFLHDAGIDTTLRHICEYSGPVSSSPTKRFGSGPYTLTEEDVREKAREALHILEYHKEMSV